MAPRQQIRKGNRSQEIAHDEDHKGVHDGAFNGAWARAV
jgi:hypothetical protein